MIIRMIERSLVYPIPSRERGDWRPQWLRPQNVWFRSADDTKLHGWYVPHAEAEAADRLLPRQRRARGRPGQSDVPAAVASAGDGVCVRLSRLRSQPRQAARKGLHRRRHGRPALAGRAEGVATDDIVVMGRSIGGGVAVGDGGRAGRPGLGARKHFLPMTDAAALCIPGCRCGW